MEGKKRKNKKGKRNSGPKAGKLNKEDSLGMYNE
jgi:hypothetical protein